MGVPHCAATCCPTPRGTCHLDFFLAQLVREAERGPKRVRGTKALAAASQPQLAQAVRDMVEAVPWGHHVNLLSKLGDPGQRLFCLPRLER
jgi:hypothetical protein